MSKIPVGATIARAYRFAFGDFFEILRVNWLPLAITSVLSVVLTSRVVVLQTAVTEAPGTAGPLLFSVLPLYVAVFFLMFVQVIGIAQLALGLRAGPSWFHFPLGKPLWRLIGSVLLLIIALIIAYVLLILATLVVAALGGFLAKLLPAIALAFSLLAIVAAAALWCGYIYAVTRLTFLLLPVVAAGEPGFALERAWSLGKGNFWRIFAISLAIILPFAALEFAILLGFVWRGITLPPFPATAAQMENFQAAMQARNLAMMETVDRYWYVSVPAFAIFTLLFYGIWAGAQSFAYRALTQDTATTPNPP